MIRKLLASIGFAGLAGSDRAVTTRRGAVSQESPNVTAAD
jgi:hypothetical protein